MDQRVVRIAKNLDVRRTGSVREFAPDEAARELMRRRSDAALMRRVEDYIGCLVPAGLPKVPFAGLARHVATCRGEDSAFMMMASEMGLDPWWVTYHEDVFTTSNADKAGYCKIPFADSRQDTGVRKVPVVHKMGQYDNRCSLAELPTCCQVDGRSLNVPELHRHFRKKVYNGTSENAIDISAWLKQIVDREQRLVGQANCNNSRLYYPFYLGLFVCHGVLVEDFAGGPNGNTGQLERFVQGVALPAFRRIKEATGLDVLYVRLPWEPHFAVYPDVLLLELKAMMA